MKNMKIEKIVDYIVIFILIIIVNIFMPTIQKVIFSETNTADVNNDIIMHNIKELNIKVSQIQDIIKVNASGVKLKDRLDPKLIKEFGKDSEFLNKIAQLKKQIIKRKLEREVVELENEKIARNNTIKDSEVYRSPFQKKLASKVFDVMMINATNSSAIVKVDNNVVTIRVGDNIKGFIIRKVNNDSIVVGHKGGDDEVLGLNYLTKKKYTKEQEKGEKNAK